MRKIQLVKLKKILFSALLTIGALTEASAVHAVVSQAPLNLVEGVSPNIILTLDESGSMSWGHIPDAGATAYDNLIGDYNTKRYRANNTNPMYYSPHIIYEIPPAFQLNGNEYTLSTSFTSAPMNGFNPSGTKVNLSNNYRVIREHRIPSGTLNYASHPSGVGGGVNTGTTAYYYEFDGSLIKTAATRNSPAIMCDGLINDFDAGGEKCYSIRYVDQTSAYDKNGGRLRYSDGALVDGRQNFAIWYSFYRSRALATLSAASIAFYDLSSNIRFTWQDLATCTSFTDTTSGSGKCYANSLKPFSVKHRGEFYSWLRNLSFSSSTPLPAAMRRAGEYLKTDTPWKMNPQGAEIGGKNSENTRENTLACRSSYHVMMTDGIWNPAGTDPSSFLQDSSTFTTPTGTKYTARYYSAIKPFYDSKTKTLADFAMHYWATDLRADLENKVPSFTPFKNKDIAKEYWDPRNNPAEWQHMSNFIMGLGLTTSLSNSSIPWYGQTHAGSGYADLVSGKATWPPASTNSENNVYDLWHAAINSRGDFYSVDSPADMVKAFKDILGRISERQATAALPAISASVEEIDDADPSSTQKLASFFYRSSYDSTDWSGDLEKIKSYISYVDGKRTELTATVWKANNKLPDHTARKIYMAGSGSSKLQEFTTSNASAALKNYLNKEPDKGTVDDRWKDRLNYIRGDKSHEVSFFRERSFLLGDFLGSSPVLVSGARYLEGFANKIEGPTHNKYTAFVASKKNRRAQVYIGGNAGMLHGFDAATGVEKFAFVPTAVFPNLNRLTGQKYWELHSFYVDGAPAVADVYDGSDWRTVLVGTLRAGGKSIFALDITDPDDIKLLWEKGEYELGDVKLGYTFPKPTIARMHNGRWAVVTGNGYENGDNSGKAALYMIDAITGGVTSIEVQSPQKTNNGLSTPKLVDFDADGVADYAYAGDTHGNLWRFDLLGDGAGENRAEGSIYGNKTGGTTKFKVSYGGKPMFSAKFSSDRAQAITAPPSIVRHPNRSSYLVVFGTGKYYEEGDKGGDLTAAQSIYAIWDEKTMAQETPSALNISRSNLVEQSFIEQVVGINAIASVNRDGRTLTNNLVDWESKKGWVLDLKVGATLSGEMLIDDMAVVGTTFLFSSLVPNDDPCAYGSSNWLYAINPFTGGRTERHVFDTRYIDSDDNSSVLSGIKYGDGGGVPLNLTVGGLEVPSSKGAEGINISEMTGRQTWRVVPAL